jgi:chaperone modulatory protein CbpM
MKTDITTIVISEQQLVESELLVSVEELCERCGLKPPLVAELVGLGLVDPTVADAGQWRFRVTAVPRLHQAMRLRHELDLDWQGVAVAMDLLEELQALRQQVTSLERQLGYR